MICWRCNKIVDKSKIRDPNVIIDCSCKVPVIDIKIRVPSNLCDECHYSIKLIVINNITILPKKNYIKNNSI